MEFGLTISGCNNTNNGTNTNENTKYNDGYLEKLKKTPLFDFASQVNPNIGTAGACQW